eukprot:GHVQ01007654.1.p1 GENE.GHVQ01007654.1~~GHVQ01007654.1.p1  ORF type:complete len:1344 (+),score=181.37 GHVQ01007654.1:897-4928(+)
MHTYSDPSACSMHTMFACSLISWNRLASVCDIRECRKLASSLHDKGAGRALMDAVGSYVRAVSAANVLLLDDTTNQPSNTSHASCDDVEKPASTRYTSHCNDSVLAGCGTSMRCSSSAGGEAFCGSSLLKLIDEGDVVGPHWLQNTYCHRSRQTFRKRVLEPLYSRHRESFYRLTQRPVFVCKVADQVVAVVELDIHNSSTSRFVPCHPATPSDGPSSTSPPHTADIDLFAVDKAGVVGGLEQDYLVRVERRRDADILAHPRLSNDVSTDRKREDEEKDMEPSDVPQTRRGQGRVGGDGAYRLPGERSELAFVRQWVIDPVFEYFTRTIVKDLIRYVGAGELYVHLDLGKNLPCYLIQHFTTIPPRRTPKLTPGRSSSHGSTVLPLPETHKRLYSYVAEPSSYNQSYNSPADTSTNSSAKALCRIQKPSLVFRPIRVPHRLVVVGASDAGVSFILHLLSKVHINFTSITLVAPDWPGSSTFGAPHSTSSTVGKDTSGGKMIGSRNGSSASKDDFALLRSKSCNWFRQDHNYLRRMLFDFRVRIIRSRMVSLDSKKKMVNLKPTDSSSVVTTTTAIDRQLNSYSNFPTDAQESLSNAASSPPPSALALPGNTSSSLTLRPSTSPHHNSLTGHSGVLHYDYLVVTTGLQDSALHNVPITHATSLLPAHNHTSSTPHSPGMSYLTPVYHTATAETTPLQSTVVPPTPQTSINDSTTLNMETTNSKLSSVTQPPLSSPCGPRFSASAMPSLSLRRDQVLKHSAPYHRKHNSQTCQQAHGAISVCASNLSELLKAQGRLVRSLLWNPLCRVVVYGSSLSAYCTLNGLLQRNVPPQKILLVLPPHCSDTAACSATTTAASQLASSADGRAARGGGWCQASTERDGENGELPDNAFEGQDHVEGKVRQLLENMGVVVLEGLKLVDVQVDKKLRLRSIVLKDCWQDEHSAQEVDPYTHPICTEGITTEELYSQPRQTLLSTTAQLPFHLPTPDITIANPKPPPRHTTKSSTKRHLQHTQLHDNHISASPASLTVSAFSTVTSSTGTWKDTSKYRCVRCRVLLTADSRSVDPQIFRAVHDNGLVYDGRLVVDHQFQTTDPFIFAAGSLCEFSRRYKPSTGTSLRQDPYNGAELGQRLADSLLRLLDPLRGAYSTLLNSDRNLLHTPPQVGTNSYKMASIKSSRTLHGNPDQRLPRFWMPVGQEGLLPGGVHYVDIKRCRGDLAGHTSWPTAPSSTSTSASWTDSRLCVNYKVTDTLVFPTPSPAASKNQHHKRDSIQGQEHTIRGPKEGSNGSMRRRRRLVSSGQYCRIGVDPCGNIVSFTYLGAPCDQTHRYMHTCITISLPAVDAPTYRC